MIDFPLPPPSAPAWFFHRIGGERHLGIALPTGEWLDVGRDDELVLLAEGGLRADHLRALADDGEPIRSRPEFEVPVRRPSKILCLGKNYAAHAREMGGAVPEEPFAFAKLSDTLIPYAAPVVIPYWLDSAVEHEVELAAIVGFVDRDGRGRKHLRAEEALASVAGYTVFNDVTARKLQAGDRAQGHPWLRAKSIDTFGPIGPWVVPADALDPRDLAIRLSVHGQVRQDGRTSQMAVGVGEALAYLSRSFTLRPGDIVALGTPAGVGPVEDGDVMLAEIEGIGCLANPVHKEPAPPAP
ncbi:MAG TPA: fumarylacetoacetate hydrolase family protein [Planctomycetota bacterium]|nr:fumarylacetoacetate hydrolase family protein [Planctomycetota bacterium]